jgi:hypothetical protein
MSPRKAQPKSSKPIAKGETIVRCGTCIHWKLLPKQDDPQVRKGFCLFGPPVMFPVKVAIEAIADGKKISHVVDRFQTTHVITPEGETCHQHPEWKP